jgi:Rrf2 family nitric oxide-sensitive transcriptional repressor
MPHVPLDNSGDGGWSSRSFRRPQHGWASLSHNWIETQRFVSVQNMVSSMLLWGPYVRLLASTDYALRILMLLGQDAPEGTTNVPALAERLGGLSRNHLHKIVQELAALGVVRTVRGANGGVRLAKPARDVRIGALVRALEADQAMVECFRADHGCSLEPGCRLQPMLRKARKNFYETLDDYTLADCLPGRRAREAKQTDAGRQRSSGHP